MSQFANHACDQDDGVPGIRQWSRFPSAEAEPVYLVAPRSKPLAVHLTDESFRGAGIEIPAEDAARFDWLVVDMEVAAIYRGAPMPAVVRNRRERDDGSLFIGIEWIG